MSLNLTRLAWTSPAQAASSSEAATCDCGRSFSIIKSSFENCAHLAREESCLLEMQAQGFRSKPDTGTGAPSAAQPAETGCGLGWGPRRSRPFRLQRSRASAASASSASVLSGAAKRSACFSSAYHWATEPAPRPEPAESPASPLFSATSTFAASPPRARYDRLTARSETGAWSASDIPWADQGSTSKLTCVA